MAAKNGHTESVKILAPLTPNPNSKDNQGETPASIARKANLTHLENKKLDHQPSHLRNKPRNYKFHNSINFLHLIISIVITIKKFLE